MKKITIIVAFIAATLTIGCTDATKAQFGGYGSKYKVTLYGASPDPIREWVSTGKVATEEGSDGWFFMDSKTNKLVRVSGNVVVEEL